MCPKTHERADYLQESRVLDRAADILGSQGDALARSKTPLTATGFADGEQIIARKRIAVHGVVKMSQIEIEGHREPEGMAVAEEAQ